MRHADELDAEDPDIDHVTRLDAMQQHVAEKLVFFEFAFRQSCREVRTINRDVESFEQVRQRAKMVFVTVCENYRSDVVAVFVKKIEVGNGNVDAVGRLFGKAHARVENQHLVAVAHSHAIHSKLADTAERDDLEDTSHRRIVPQINTDDT